MSSRSPSPPGGELPATVVGIRHATCRLRVLEDADFPEITEGFRGRAPLTTVLATRGERTVLDDYVSALHGMIDKVQGDDE